MGIWTWLAIGVTAFLCVSLLAGVAIAAALSEIARRASKLLDEEAWVTAPPTRATEAAADEESPRRSIEKAGGPRAPG
jgi:hypothetical protein